jgi:hypothetical protein
MERQIFINEMQARFNLRKPRSEKPTNLYLVCRINNKQVKLSTGVKIYPDHWNEKRQEAYISVRLSELDNINNTIVNKKITKLKEYFIEFKHYLCMHPDEIGESMKLLKQHIYKDRMKKELQKPATFIMKQIIEAKTCAESRKKQNRNQPKHEVPVNHRLMACRDFFCTEFTCILCGVGRNTQVGDKQKRCVTAC